MENKQELALNTAVNPYSKESAKLTKNSRGVTWEIRIIADKDNLSEKDLERLEKLHEDFKERYEGEGNNDDGGELNL